MSKKRIILDTNILISGLVFSSCKPQQVFDLVREHHTLLMSEATLAEVLKVFIRPKFDKYISLEKRLAFITGLKRQAEMIITTETITDCRDPKDNKFLELAASGRANFLITGDQDLLVLNPFRDTEILTVNDFIENFNS